MVKDSENTDGVVGLLGSLPRVEAPNDFDFRVKARIASERPVPISWFPTAARVAIPLGLVLSVGGYFGYQTIYQPVPVDVATVENTSADPDVEQQPLIGVSASGLSPSLSGDTISPEKMVVKPQTADDKIAAPVNNAPNRQGSPARIPGSDSRGGGSFDTAVKESRTIYPLGLNPHTRTTVRPKDFDKPGMILAKDVLTQFGAVVVYSGSGWRVETVKDNSSAKQAGLRSGDVVQAINDVPLNEKTSFNGQFSGKSMRLKRDGSTFIIDLKKP